MDVLGKHKGTKIKLFSHKVHSVGLLFINQQLLMLYFSFWISYIEGQQYSIFSCSAAEEIAQLR